MSLLLPKEGIRFIKVYYIPFSMAILDVLSLLQGWGILEAILPFFLIFTVMFAVLERTKIFGSKGNPKAYHVVISLVSALLFIVSAERISILNVILIKIIFLMIIAVVVFMITSIFVENPFLKNPYWILGIFLVLVIIVVSSFNWFSKEDLSALLGFLINPILFGVVAFVGVLWFITRDKKGGSESVEEREEEKASDSPQQPGSSYQQVPSKLKKHFRRNKGDEKMFDEQK